MDNHRFSKTMATLLAVIVLLWQLPTVSAQTGAPADPGGQHRGRRITNAERKAAAERFKNLRDRGKPIASDEGKIGVETEPPTPGVAITPTPQQIRDTRDGGPADVLNHVGAVPDYCGIYANYLNSQFFRDIKDPVTGAHISYKGIRKFIDKLPGLGPDPDNVLGQYIPVATPDKDTFVDCDYYEIEVVQYEEKMHSDLPGPCKLRGFRQTNMGGTPAHYLGPMIVAQGGKGDPNSTDPNRPRPVRIKFTNRLPSGDANGDGRPDGDLFIPNDLSVMGAGVAPNGTENYLENRVAVHLHGGNTPWISDGTPHQWIVPAGDYGNTNYTQGDSLYNVPDMWFGDKAGVRELIPYASNTKPEPVGYTNVSNDPGPGSFTLYYSNQQSARLLFYHDHALGITRLNVHVGVAAGFIIRDKVEQDLIAEQVIPADEIPLVIQDKTWVPDTATQYTNAWGTFDSQLDAQDPLWDTTRWGGAGSLWYPHVYVPLQNAYDTSGVNHMGRWHWSGWFWPPFMPKDGLISNPYSEPDRFPAPWVPPLWEPPMVPRFPRPSGVAESFFDTPVVNGTAYPYVEVQPKPYRLRILNAAQDRYWNLQLYVADSTVKSIDDRTNTEVAMVDAVATPGFPNGSDPTKTTGTRFAQRWPTSGEARPMGLRVPSPAAQGPPFIQIGNEAGFLPEPAVIYCQPVDWNWDTGAFDFSNINTYALMLGPAERADVIVDFGAVDAAGKPLWAGKTLILYNDAPAPLPANDARYDCYTGNGDMTDIGGPENTPIGWGPNTRTIMQIRVLANDPGGAPYPVVPFDLVALKAAFKSTAITQGAFAAAQKPMLVPQSYYNSAYNDTFPKSLPPFIGTDFIRINDTSKTFIPFGQTGTFNLEFKPKSMHDEMGATFDPEYGRMSTKLGVEQPRSTPQTLTTILYSFYDPPTEVILPSVSGTPVGVTDDGTQIWKITHNGVDTHAMHFHEFDVQLINRVSWSNNVRFPDPNEVGWKDTVKVHPLQDTFVALRPILPVTPFKVPNSVRLLAPTLPLHKPLLNIWGGAESANPSGKLVTITNELVNFGWEYVWHCHLLAHEENDMMRAVATAPVPEAPTNLAGVPSAQPQVVLTWDNNTVCATSFTVERADDEAFTMGLVPWVAWTGLQGTPVTTYTDTSVIVGQTYYYRVFASNTVGSTVEGFPQATTNSAYSNTAKVEVVVAGPNAPTNLAASLTEPRRVNLSWNYTQGSSVPATQFLIERATGTGAFASFRTVNVGTTSTTDTTVADGTTYSYRVFALAGTQSSAASNIVTIPIPVIAAPTNLKIQTRGTNYLIMSWKDNSPNNTNFRIQRSLNGVDGWIQVGTAGANTTSFRNNGLAGKTRYYFQVQAYAGTTVSNWSNVASDTTR